METFKTFVGRLYEDEATDASFRREASAAYSAVVSYIKQNKDNKIKIDLHFTPHPDGSFMAKATDLGLNADHRGLYFKFAPLSQGRSRGIRGGLGFIQGHTPVLVFYCLLGNHDLTYLDTRLDRNTFIHEMIHYYDWKRIGRRLPKSGNESKFGGRVPDVVAASNYVNSPGEFNAHYQEATSVALHTATTVPVYVLTKMLGSTFEEFLDIAKRRYFPDYYIEYLNSSYKRKLEKRLYRFYVKTLAPIIHGRLHDQ